MEKVGIGKYKTSLTAPGLKNIAVTNITMDLESNKGPVYNYELDETKFKEKWSVNRRILGKVVDGYQFEEFYYATEALKQLMVDRGIEIANIKKKSAQEK